MNPSKMLRAALVLLVIVLVGAHAALADTSHARIIRLSLVQGDVRFSRAAHGDPLSDSKTVWEAAELNLPIRHGYVLATDNGRAEVEFENGAMAFLSENTVLEFYDLSLEDGARTTRLVLRQGSASFSVNPARGDYFSVTGGDFTVEATGHTTFRVNDYDDGSNVDVSKGRVAVLHKDDSTPLEKGQSLSMRAGNASVNVARLAESDDFDRWVAGRVDSVTTATTAALQYTNSPYYSSGFADLYNYGSWSPVSGYGFGWRPYGVGLGWSPFDDGNWFFDSAFGWGFNGFQPWGWAPYHFGSWLFEPGFGWVWLPGGFNTWRPSTGVWVRSKGGAVGVVPAHPMDVHGKPPVNLAHGVFPVNGKSVAAPVSVAVNEWKVVKSPPRGTLQNNLVAASAPARVSRTAPVSTASSRTGAADRGSSIAYDANGHRFVNSNAPPANAPVSSGKPSGAQVETRVSGSASGQPTAVTIMPGTTLSATPAASTPQSGVAPSTTTTTRTSNAAPPAATATRAATPPAHLPPARVIPTPVRSGGGGTSSAGSSGGTRFDGNASSGGGTTHASAPPAAPAPRSSPAPSGRPH